MFCKILVTHLYSVIYVIESLNVSINCKFFEWYKIINILKPILTGFFYCLKTRNL